MAEEESGMEFVSINERIAYEMKIRGMTVYKLAKLSKVSKTAIKNWFSAIPHTPSEKSLIRIAKVFDMSVEELVNGCGEEKNEIKELMMLWNRLKEEEKDTFIKQIREKIKL